VEADHEQLSGRVLRTPEPSEIQAPVDTQPIVELYSR
jgi:ribosomal protein S4